LAVVAIANGSIGQTVTGFGSSPARLIGAALIPGLLGILLFYRGLSGTKASYAVVAEFTYPAAAIVGNWMMLGTTLAPLQALGCVILLAAIFVVVHRSSAPAQAPATARVAAPALAASGGD
jgi:drug/metabolite transporter (DMT)-like permease